MKIVKIHKPRLACFALYHSPARLIWRGDYATYHVEVVTPIAESSWSSWISVAVMPRVVGSTLSLVGSGRRSNVAATLKTSSDRADVAVIVLEQQHSDKGNDIRFSKTVKQGSACGPKAARELKFCGPRKGLDFQASITVFERYCQGRIKGTLGLRLNRYFLKIW